MPVTISINHENAYGALDELRAFSAGLHSDADLPKRTPRPEVAATVAQQNTDAAASTLKADEAPAAAEPVKKTRAKKAEAPKPEAPETTAATQAQDKADEEDETDATSDGKLTHDSVRAALGLYVKAYGMAAAQEDGPKVLSLIFGNGKSKVSDVPDTQEDLAKAIAGINEMIEKNPYKRAAVGL